MSSKTEQLRKVGLELQPYWSTKYLKNVDKLSKPEYEIKEEKDVYVAVRDGVKLCVDIYLPDIEEKKFPALVGWSSYGKDSQWGIRKSPRAFDSLMYDAVETGDIDFFVPRGYAFVVPDPRGVGKSEGEWHGPYCTQEQEDCYDVIEWIAEQPWCDGNIGMTGISYYGMIQPHVAALQPPHLKAMMPMPVVDDYYTHAYIGGVLSDYYFRFLGHTAPNNGVSESEKIYTEEELKRKIKERLEDPDVRDHTRYVSVLSCWPPRLNTWFFDVLLHPLDGPFWESRHEYNKRDKIKIPWYGVVDGLFGGGQASIPYTSGPFKAFADPRLDVPKKVAAMGMAIQCPWRYFREEVLRWYDHWFKGIDTGIMDEPPVKIFVNGVNKYRFEYEWPPERTKWMKLYLRRYKKLEPQQIEDADLPPDVLVHEPPLISTIEDVQSRTYLTEPLVSPMDVTGHVLLCLYAAIDVDDASFIAKLWDVFPTGVRSKVTEGLLRASHRMIKQNLEQYLSKPWLPIVDHTKSVPIKPGEINEHVIEMKAMSNVFQPGHRIELEIKSMDPEDGRSGATSGLNYLPSSKLTIYKIYRDAKYPSHLLLPVIPETPQELWIETPIKTPFYPYSQI